MFDNQRIKVTNTAIIVDNYTLHESEELEHPFQIFDPVTHKFSFKGFYYDEENKRLFLPAGMDLWFVRKCLNEKYYTRLDSHPYKTFSGVQIKYKPRDDRQIEALKFMVGIDDYDENSSKHQLLVSLATGVGKTYCSIATACFFQIKSIVITASNSLLTQWEDNILEYTNMTKNDICRISGSDMCNMILLGNSNKADNAKIYLCSHGTLRSFGDTYGWDKVYNLFEKLGIGLKFYDEAHTSYDNMLMIDFHTNVYKTYYVTATPGRSNYKENHIFQISLKNVPMIDLYDEDLKHTSYIAIKWNSKPSHHVVTACKNRMYGLDRNKYMEWVTQNQEFYKMLKIIMDMIIPVLNRNDKVLMYVGTNNGILRVYHWIAEHYPNLIGSIGIFTSLVSKEDKLKEKKKKLLLSTTKSAGLGEHINRLKVTIVLAEPFRSDILARQTLGRTRDDNTQYIELVDVGFLYTKKFYLAKLPVFNKYATDVSDTTIDSYELNRRCEIIDKNNDTWVRCPIRLDDKRFNFEEIGCVEDKIDPDVPRCPITFHKIEKDKKNKLL